MGLLPHSVWTTSCPPLYGCVPGLRETHSCAVFVCSFVITSPSQSLAMSLKPIHLSVCLSLPFPFYTSLTVFFFFFSWHCLISQGTRCSVGDKAVMRADGGTSVMTAAHDNPVLLSFFFCLGHQGLVIFALSVIRLAWLTVFLQILTQKILKFKKMRLV